MYFSYQFEIFFHILTSFFPFSFLVVLSFSFLFLLKSNKDKLFSFSFSFSFPFLVKPNKEKLFQNLLFNYFHFHFFSSHKFQTQPNGRWEGHELKFHHTHTHTHTHRNMEHTSGLNPKLYKSEKSLFFAPPYCPQGCSHLPSKQIEI